MRIRVTVCQLHDEPDDLAHDWEGLVAHAQTESSRLVLLPEMPFYPWFGATRPFDAEVWGAAVEAHDRWLARLNDLAPAVVLGSRPVNKDGRRLNEGFVWDQETGYLAAHTKYYLPDEEGFWEASWYSRGDGRFDAAQSRVARVGFQICTDLWFPERARSYGKQGARLIATPRATSEASLDKWLAGGRVTAIMSGAFSLSSNRVNREGRAVRFGGQGWVIGPEGDVLGLTSQAQPFVTVEIDLSEAERARSTYPRYVLE